MTPSAVGKLSETPLSHALAYASNRRLTGRLELTAPDERFAAVSIWRGTITAVETVPVTASPGSFFGAIAYELGIIDATTLDATLLEIATTRRLHGEVLVERGAITSAQRDEVLIEQIHRKVHFLFSLPEATTYAFYDAKFVFERPPIAVDCIGPIWRGLRDFPPARFVTDTLGRIGDHALRATAGASAHLPPEEVALVRALAARPMTIAEMKRAATGLRPERVELLVYLLVITKCVEAVSGVRTHPSTGALPVSMESGPLPASGAVRRASVPRVAGAVTPSAGVPRVAGAVTPSAGVPRVVAGAVTPSAGVPRVAGAVTPASGSRAFTVPGPRELGVEGIRAYAARVDGLDPFAVLGLPESASVEAARAAYFRYAKEWHPDRLPGELAAAHPSVVRIFARMSEAHRQITEQPTPVAPVARAAPKPGAGEAPTREAALRDARARMARRDFTAVTELCEGLLDRQPEDAEALALHTWASVSGGEASDDAVRAALATLERAVSFDRTCDRTVYLRGLAHKRLGNVPAAFRDFARAVQLEPKNIDAEREVRLYAMRARKGSGERTLVTSLLDKVTRKK